MIQERYEKRYEVLLLKFSEIIHIILGSVGTSEVWTHGGQETGPPGIHRSAWKGYSPKLNFRFTAFSEIRYPQATLKQQQEYATWQMLLAPHAC